MSKIFIKIVAVLIASLMILCVITVRELEQSLTELDATLDQLLINITELERVVELEEGSMIKLNDSVIGLGEASKQLLKDTIELEELELMDEVHPRWGVRQPHFSNAGSSDRNVGLEEEDDNE